MADQTIGMRRTRRALSIDADILALVKTIEAHEESFARFLRDRFRPAEERVRANPRDQLARKRFQSVQTMAGAFSDELVNLVRRLASIPSLSINGERAKARTCGRLGVEMAPQTLH